MTIDQLINVARTFPVADQDRIIAALTKDRLTRLEREFGELLRPGFVAEVWAPQHDPACSKIIEQELKKLNVTPS